MLKIFYKYVNELIDEDTLVEEIKNLAGHERNKERRGQILDLMYLIKIAMIMYKNSNYELYDAIYELFLSNPLYNELAGNVNSKDLMNLITGYMKVQNPPHLNQKEFNELVEEAKNSINSKEKCFRLALNYELYNLDFSKIEDYFIEKRDAWYMSLYVSSIDSDCYNLDKLVSKISSTNDEKYISKLLSMEPFMKELSFEQLTKLENLLK